MLERDGRRMAVVLESGGCGTGWLGRRGCAGKLVGLLLTGGRRMSGASGGESVGVVGAWISAGRGRCPRLRVRRAMLGVGLG